MKNVKIKNNLILIFTLSLFLSCKQMTTNKNENKVKFTNFYEKVDSIKLDHKNVCIEKFYNKKNIKYIISLSTNKKYIIPASWYGSQPSDFSIKKEKNNWFKINFMKGNATFYDYSFYFDKDDRLNLSKINFSYNYNIKDTIIKDSIFINKEIINLKKSDIKKITSFINK